jgi:hypothetical protein
MPFIYTFSTGSTEVYDASDYSGVDTLQAVSEANQNKINSVYNINYQKIFAGPISSSTGLTIYDSGNTKTVINVSADTFGIAVDNTNDLVAIVNTSNGGAIDNIVVVVDASTNTVVNTIDVGFNGSYKGGIASDNNGYCYVVGSESAMTKVDIVNGVTADTINIGGTGQLNRKVLFNGVSNFIYVLNPVSSVKSFDASDGSPLNTLSITANTTFFIFNPDKEQIYLGSITGGTNNFFIRTLNRNLTLISETFIFSGASSAGEGIDRIFGFYSTDTQYLYVGDIGSDSILVLTT